MRIPLPFDSARFISIAALAALAGLAAAGTTGCAQDASGNSATTDPEGPARDQGPQLDLDAAGSQTDATGSHADAIPTGDAAMGTDAGDAAPTQGDAVAASDGPPPPPVPVTQCNNGVDDDMDGVIDLLDSDCTSETDPTEAGGHAPAACGNGVDDDGDGLLDFPDDGGCTGAGDGDETDDPAHVPQCNDGIDNDGNGHADYPDDPSCPGRGVEIEHAPTVPPACSDGIDNDEDGASDYPDDTDCMSAASTTEAGAGACGAGRQVINLNQALAGAEFVDGNTGQGTPGYVGTCGGNAGPEVVYAYTVAEFTGAIEFTTEYPETTAPTVLYIRSACDDPQDLGCNRGSAMTPGTHVRIERAEPGTYYVVVDTSLRDQSGAFRLGVHTVDAPRCSDRRDNDVDGRTDLDDPGCVDAADDDEADPVPLPECGDGVDNDGDGLTDYPNDPTCHAAGGPRETDASCQLSQDITLIDAPGGLVHSSTLALADHYQGQCGGQGPESIVAVNVLQPGSITVDILNNDYDTVIFARAACDDPATEMGCNDDFNGTASHLDLVTPAAGVYYIFIDGFAGEAGNCDVQVTVR